MKIMLGGDMTIRIEKVSAGRVNAHIAQPERPRGGVLMLPTITGVDAFMQERAYRVAEAGYAAMVWDPYPGELPPADLPSAQVRAVRLNDGAVDGMADCVGYMRDQLRLTAVAVLGFCLGGRYAVLLAARDKRLFACVTYYPSIRVPMSANQSLDAMALAADIACPVHLIHAGADQVFVPSAFAQLRDVLERRAVATVAEVHPGAVHSFMRPDLQKIPANASASRLSWPQALSFLDTCLAAHASAKIPD
jgi:carboxymethylenebutenolidase